MLKNVFTGEKKTIQFIDNFKLWYDCFFVFFYNKLSFFFQVQKKAGENILK